MAHTPRPQTESEVEVGQEFLGKYRVEAILGQGGMGVVVKCIHLDLNKPVAIKMLRQDVLSDRDATERFTREARAASRLKSEHVAEVVDVGVFPSTGVPYMIMEFLDGHDLGQLVDERGPLQPPLAAMLMLQAAEALAEAHSRDIVHRDVKPSNLFVCWRPDGSAMVKVLDFGISKSPIGVDMKLTQTQSLLGTPAYMSPEQMRSARLVDARTDIWSLGTVFYELLEGRRPFEADSFSEMCVKVAMDPPDPMVNAPPELQAIIMRCLAKNADQRYANMAELGRDLLPHALDVHQASHLVERMQRLVTRKSGGDNWENLNTGVSRIATPVPGSVRDIASAPIANPAWHGGSDAIGTPVPTPPRSGVVPAAAAPPTSMVATEAPKRRRWPIVLLAFAVIAVAVLSFTLLRDRSNNDTVAPAADDHATTTPPPVPGSAATTSTATTPTPTPTPTNVGAPDPTADVDGTADGSAGTVTHAGSAKESGSAGNDAGDIDTSKIVIEDNTPPKPAITGRGRPKNPIRHIRRPVRRLVKKHDKKHDVSKKHDVKKPDDNKPEDAMPAKAACPLARRLPGGGCAPE